MPIDFGVYCLCFSYNSSTEDHDRFAELQALLAQARHHVQNADSSDLAMERRLRAKLEQQLAEEKAKREELVEQQIQLREKTTNTGLVRYSSIVVDTSHSLGWQDDLGVERWVCNRTNQGSYLSIFFSPPP